MKTAFLLILSIVLPLAVGCTNSADRALAAGWAESDARMAQMNEETKAQIADTKISIGRTLFGPDSAKAQTYTKCLTHPPTQKANQITCENLEREIKRALDRQQAKEKTW